MAERPAQLALLFVLALAVHATVSLAGAHVAGLDLSSLGVYFDGHLYLEIARSFPLPYAAEGIPYTGFAPGYPALIAALRALLPDAWFDWGTLAILASVVPAALAALAFYALARELDVAPLWPSVVFVVGNWRWMWASSTPNAEPLATCLALLCFVAHLRGRLVWAVTFLSLAGLTRFPAFLLGVPLAFDLLVRQRRWDLRTLALLAVPPLAFAAFVAYLHLRIPGYPGLATAHRTFWDTHPTWPFAALWSSSVPELWPADFPSLELTWAFALLYLVSMAVGLRASGSGQRMLALWVGVIVLFHASLSGLIGAWAFQRLVLLAWPAAVLILWPAFGRRLPTPARAALCVVLALSSGWLSLRAAEDVGQWQRGGHLRNALRRVDSDQPHWVRFRSVTPEAPREAAP